MRIPASRTLSPLLILVSVIGMSGDAGAAKRAILTRAAPAPGQFTCDKVTASIFVSGLCVYQARPYGFNAFDSLLNYAQRKVSDDMTTAANPKIRRPSALDRTAGTISWWFPDDAANQEFGTALADADVQTTIAEKDAVVMTLTMYSFDKSYSRDFGLDLGIFDGKVPNGTVAPPTVLGSLVKGVFNLASGIGNPLASYLNFSIQAQIEKKHSSVIASYPIPACEVGSTCPYSHTTKYYVAPTALTPISETLGITTSFKPRISNTDPTLVTLQDLLITYATPTGDPLAPVDVLNPYQYTNLTLHTNQAYVIGGETHSRDVRTGKLLGGGKDQGHTQFMFIMTAKIVRAGEVAPRDDFEFDSSPQKVYTAEERKKLEHPEMTLQDVLGSLHRVCFADHVNPGTAEQICGYELQKMSTKYLDYPMKVSIRGHLPNPEDAEKMVILGDLYTGKGYFRLPMMDPMSVSSRYKVTFAMNKKSELGRELRSQEAVKGVHFTFAYTPKVSTPVDLDPQEHPELLHWIE